MNRRAEARARLHAAIDAALDAAELELAPASRATDAPLTALQVLQNRLLGVVHDAQHELEDETAAAFFAFLIDVTARHALRASWKRPPA